MKFKHRFYNSIIFGLLFALVGQVPSMLFQDTPKENNQVEVQERNQIETKVLSGICILDFCL